jgi:peptidoglycan/LPS O-acetylase OafA/YrhL
LNHENNFNLLRLLAAAQVVYMHGIDHLKLPFSWSSWYLLIQFPGVACFFIISGFLVTQSFMGSTLPSFALKRALRIYPGLFVNITILEVLVFIGGGLTIASWFLYLTAYLPIYLTTASTWYATAATHGVTGVVPVTFGGGFFPIYPSGVLWTLTVELSFYLVLPFFLLLVKWSRPIGTGATALAMVYSLYLAMTMPPAFNGRHPIVDVTVARYFWIFGLGILSNLYWEKIRFLIEGKVIIWAIAYAVVTAGIFTFIGTHFLFASPTKFDEPVRMIILAGLLLSAAFSFRKTTKILKLDKNDYSYGLYLYHMLVIATLMALDYHSAWWLWLAVYAATFTISALSWFFIEKPANALKKMRLQSPIRTLA